jgi:hypothetical protein
VVTKALGVEIIGSAETQDFCLTDRKASVVPLGDSAKKSIADWLKGRTIHWLDEPSQANAEAKRRLNTLMREVGMSVTEIQTCIQVHPYKESVPYHQNVKNVYQAMNGEGHSFLSDANIDTWLRGSNLAVQKNPETGAWVAGGAKEELTRGQPFKKLPKSEQDSTLEMLRNRFVEMTGARSLGLALDNDGAGKADADKTRTLCNQIGIPVAELMPDERKKIPVKLGSKQEVRDLKDHNDYLMLYRDFQDHGQQQDADTLLQQYASFMKKPEFLLEPSPELEKKIGVRR